MTLTGRALRLSEAVGRLALSSAVVTRKHSITNRTTHKAGVNTLVLDGVHSEGATSLLMQLGASADDFAGRIPEGLILTIAGTNYTVAADAEETRSTRRITVTITSGLVAEAPDETVVTLADAVTDTHSKVNLRSPTRTELDRGSAARIDSVIAAGFPGHLAPRWVEMTDEVVFTLPDGRTVEGVVRDIDQAVWGQVVFA